MAGMAAGLSAALAYVADRVGGSIHGVPTAEKALLILGAAFVGAWALARPLAWVLRVGLIVVGVLVAARLAGVGIG